MSPKKHEEQAGHLIQEADCALVIIDIQEKLLPVMADPAGIVASNVKLVNFAKIMDLPIVVTEQEKLGATVDDIKNALPFYEPITKITFDACGNDDFREAVWAAGKATIAITGIEGHICVTQTVLSLLPDYRIHVIADAVGCRFPENREIALRRMEHAGAVISSSEMFMYEVLQRAGTDTFREVLKLVK